MSMFELMYHSRFYGLTGLQDLSETLDRCDFSVIASRREAHTAVADFQRSGLRGERLFSDTSQFPSGLDAVYLCTVDGNVKSWFANITTVLSHRPSNVAKDMDVGNGREVERVALARDQGEQDAFKQFNELKKLLGALINLDILRWNRRKFEDSVAGPFT
jgi:hypothetical protein